jgi:signal transduction histidine kinase
MSPPLWIDLVTCAAQLALAVVSFARIRRAPIGWFLGWFCACIAAWSAFAIAYKVTNVEAFTLVDHAISPFSAPVALDFALNFDGRRRALGRLLATAYVLCGALGAAALVALFLPGLRPFIGSRGWNVALLALAIPTMAFALVSFVAHLQRSVERLEEERTRLVIAAFGIATVLGSTDVLTPLAPGVPAMGRVGLLVGSLALALVSLHFSWAGSPARVRRFTYVLAAAGVAMLVYLAVFGFADAMASALVLGTLAATVALIVASRRWAIEAARNKERVAQLASLGRFSAQLAHDIKNPLTALKGAAQLLRDDVAPLAGARDDGPTPAGLVDLMLEEVDRLGRVVDVYGRLARVDVVPSNVDVNEVVRQVVDVHALAHGDAVKLRAELTEPLAVCRGDRDLLASVVENLVRNAAEAVASGGTVTVRTLRAPAGEPEGVQLVIEDDGIGMDAGTRERAFDDFFTTKPTGSGLGLAFVRRVVLAHGGEVGLTSVPGHGTVVRIRLPAAGGA